MNPIDKALQEIHATIPLQILQRAFLNSLQQNMIVPTSLDTIIRDKVISQRVWTDCSLAGAQEMIIPLGGLAPIQPDPYSYVYRIPKTETNGRTIMSALAVVYYLAQGWAAYGGQNSTVNGMQGQCENSELLQGAKALRDVNSSIPLISTANCQLIGENIVLINDYSGLVTVGGLRCVLAHDSEFTNIKAASYGVFAKLCVLATKAWIYTNTIVEIDQNELYGGVAIGVVKEIIQGYADANEMYEEMVNTRWRKVATMNDTIRHQRIIRRLTGFAR